MAFNWRFRKGAWVSAVVVMLLAATDASVATAAAADGAKIVLARRKPDPYGAPRPSPGQEHVALRTSFYVPLAVEGGEPSDRVLPESVSIQLRSKDGQAAAILRPEVEFAEGYSGRLFPGKDRRKGRTLIVYVDSERKLHPETTYTVQVAARSARGAELPAEEGRWRFTTQSQPATHSADFKLSLEADTVAWSGALFSGFCKPSFCTSRSSRIPSYELMDEVRKRAPRAWSLQRDAWLTGMSGEPQILPRNLPNIVRERETRRIVAVETREDGKALRVEDFFGHRQYGIPSGRPPSDDYHPGDEVLIADSEHDARARVIRVDDAAATVLVSDFPAPDGGWKLDYAAPLPEKEAPNAPGLFPPGGCYLHKFDPPGTPAYYWGRLHCEWDLTHRRFGRRLVVNFVDAPGDLSRDGRNWTTAKDYAELHAVVRRITGHLIDRYGDATLDWPWSVFNEPDLGPLFWRSDWNELQKFYDYTVDAILRAFEDRGYDSERVFVGGLELGGIFGVHLKLREFLAHCSPRAEAKGALERNAAFADPRLDGKRSRRVEKMCRAHDGRGSPCDFVSIHAYNTSSLMAAKLARAKEMALEIDPEYYAELWINSHESCPGWDMPPDPAFADSYLGNGYFPTWCADVSRRLLAQAAEDRRYAYGETILTFWPAPNRNFGGGNACTRTLHVDDDGDGRTDRTVAVAMPILHFLGLTSTMGSDYWVLRERRIGGHVVSGFAGRSEGDVRLLLYSHHELDTESRSEHEFRVALTLAGLDGPQAHVTQYRFDKDHNSYYRLARPLREARLADRLPLAGEKRRSLDAAVELLRADDVESQRRGLRRLAELGPAARPATPFLVALVEKIDDEQLRADITAAAMAIHAPVPYPVDTVARIERLARLRPTGSSVHAVDGEGNLRLDVPLAANGACFLVIGNTED